MSLWLDGGFWGPWIRRVFIPEIEWTRCAVLEHMLPSIPDPKEGGEQAQANAWEAFMTKYSDGSDDPGTFAEWAEGQGIEVYERLTNVRQAATNMATVMLWHLLEQQMLTYHLRQVLSIHEEREVKEDNKQRDKMCRLKKFHSRLEEGGCSMKSLQSWGKIEELRLVANVVKHGQGQSLDELYILRPDLLEPPGIGVTSLQSGPRPSWVEKPAGGEDIYVRDSDLESFFDAAVLLWQEFSIKIEEYSAR